MKEITKIDSNQIFNSIRLKISGVNISSEVSSGVDNFVCKELYDYIDDAVYKLINRNVYSHLRIEFEPVAFFTDTTTLP